MISRFVHDDFHAPPPMQRADSVRRDRAQSMQLRAGPGVPTNEENGFRMRD
jgi:hypothetical protein